MANVLGLEQKLIKLMNRYFSATVLTIMTGKLGVADWYNVIITNGLLYLRVCGSQAYLHHQASVSYLPS